MLSHDLQATPFAPRGKERTATDADFATTLDADPLCFHRHPEETVAMFQERVCDELRVREEHFRRKKPVQVIVFQCNSERSTDELGGPNCA